MEKEKSFKKNGNPAILPQNSIIKGPTVGMSWREWRQKKKQEYNERKKAMKNKGSDVRTPNLVATAKSRKNQTQGEVEEDLILEDLTKLRDFTVSIAVAGSILDNAQSKELKTYLAGQIARAAAIYNVNEVVIFSEAPFEAINGDEGQLSWNKKHHGCTQMVRILQYLECPQYLRKFYFPIHKDLEYAGLLNPLDIPHHLRADEESLYREGIVLDKPVKPGKGSYVNIGLKKTAIIDKILEANLRVTVQLDQEHISKKHVYGKVVSPSAPTKNSNLYWGYSVRLAEGLNAVLAESPYKGGYDLTIGTSDKGQSVDAVKLPKFKHLLIVFGGLRGLETCIEEDESITTNQPTDLFQFYLNTCPSQGSRTIRSEEAVLITLAALRPKIIRVQNAS